MKVTKIGNLCTNCNIKYIMIQLKKYKHITITKLLKIAVKKK
jgi:hypothetical protein